jgi:hypothetical protein
VLSAATASLVAVAAILAKVGALDTTSEVGRFLLGLASVVVSREFRRVALRHALRSFVFGTGIPGSRRLVVVRSLRRLID